MILMTEDRGNLRDSSTFYQLNNNPQPSDQLEIHPLFKKDCPNPSWFDSVDRMSSCELKCPKFDSAQGHIPGL